MSERNVIIIGSGPAGYTAALYTARANLEPLLIQGIEPGGQLMTTTDVENFPGFPEGIQGPELMTLMQQQAERFGTEIVYGTVSSVDFSQRPFKVQTDEETYFTKTVIISTGASARWLGLESETRMRGKGVSACATCDGFFFRGKEIAVVGGGDSALEEATFLTRFATKVNLIHRRDELRGSKIMRDRAQSNEKVAFVWNSVVTEVLSEDGNTVSGLRLVNVKTDETTVLPVQGLFLAIGHTPNTAVFKGHIELDSTGYIVLKEHTETSVPGVFAAGDVTDHRYRQAITAAGMGCMAAIDAERFLEREG